MTSLAVLVPTIGRSSLPACLDALVTQLVPGDRLDVICDNPNRFAAVSEIVRGFERQALTTIRCYPTPRLGCYGHASRNVALDHLAELEVKPEFCWSIDDDDRPTFGALDMIRTAIDATSAQWLVFRMVGGTGSHFAGVTVPATGGGIRQGEIGTPMMVFPSDVKARFGTEAWKDAPVGCDAPGYFGDYFLARWLKTELGSPEWRPEIVAEIRPFVEVAA